MDHQILDSVTVPEADEERVSSGRVRIDGREVVLICQTDTHSVFAVSKNGGDLLWIDYWLDQPRDQILAIVERFYDDGANRVANSYCNGMTFKIPYQNRARFIAEINRVPNTHQTY